MKKLIFKLLHSLGITLFAAWWNRKRVVFLCYHGVTESDTCSPHNKKGLHVNRHRFSAHLDYLQRRYRVVTLADYLEARKGGRSLGNYSVVLTFDDGFRNFLTAAAPCLEARSMPATVFLITDRTSDAQPAQSSGTWKLEDDNSYLSWDEVLELKQRLNVEFGSHTCSHPRLLTLSLEEMERELRDSYNILVRHLGVEQPSLSYPKGEYSEVIANCARKVGYHCAVTADCGANEIEHDLFTLGRTLIGDFDDEASFAVRVSGLRWWLVKMRLILNPLARGGKRTAISSTPHGEPAANLQNNVEDQSLA